MAARSVLAAASSSRNPRSAVSTALISRWSARTLSHDDRVRFTSTSSGHPDVSMDTEGGMTGGGASFTPCSRDGNGLLLSLVRQVVPTAPAVLVALLGGACDDARPRIQGLAPGVCLSPACKAPVADMSVERETGGRASCGAMLLDPLWRRGGRACGGIADGCGPRRRCECEYDGEWWLWCASACSGRCCGSPWAVVWA